MLEIESDPYSDFLFAMRSPKTKEKVVARLRMFFDFIGIPEGSMQERSKIFADKAKSNQQWVFGCVVRYLQFLKERFDKKEITAGTIKNRYQAIRLFCDMSDIQIFWKKISKALPKVRKYAEDRSPALDEIRKLIEYPDRRIKAVVYTMASSGIRVGAWDYLQWKHVVPVEKEGKIVAAKIIVYAGEDEEYFSFITLEAYRELEKWIEYRIQSGEDITDNSWLMRNIWNTKKGYTRGLVGAPLKLKSEGVKRLIDDALWTQGIRKRLTEGKKRHEFQVDHGFRKWFKTRCEMSGMRPINIEVLMNHSTGISDSYYRATENELLEDYLNAATDYLTINIEQKLRQQVEELTDTSYAESHLIREELFDKKKELDTLKQQDFINTDAIKSLSDQLTKVIEEIKILKEMNR